LIEPEIDSSVHVFGTQKLWRSQTAYQIRRVITISSGLMSSRKLKLAKPMTRASIFTQTTNSKMFIEVVFDERQTLNSTNARAGMRERSDL
jgi:hypothetical protein